VLPGAREALSAVGRRRDLVQSVLTGSIQRNAITKLKALGLDKHLDFEVGGYGSETYPKAALVELARTRARQKYGGPIADAATVLVADSPRDVQAARIARAKMIAVATGTATQAELRGAGADVVLPGLAETDQVLGAIEDLTSGS
jgi:phosphoglycolate phosphatase-like HAD superfamily hydrolase